VLAAALVAGERDDLGLDAASDASFDSAQDDTRGKLSMTPEGSSG